MGRGGGGGGSFRSNVPLRLLFVGNSGRVIALRLPHLTSGNIINERIYPRTFFPLFLSFLFFFSFFFFLLPPRHHHRRHHRHRAVAGE